MLQVFDVFASLQVFDVFRGDTAVDAKVIQVLCQLASSQASDELVSAF